MGLSRLTCLACQVGFTDAELHRVHFKGIEAKYITNPEPCESLSVFWAENPIDFSTDPSQALDDHSPGSNQFLTNTLINVYVEVLAVKRL